MPYSQSNRPLIVSTPLPQDTLLLSRFSGREGISQLFSFRLELLAEKRTKVPFEQILGQSITVKMRLRDGTISYFNGIAKSFGQGEFDDTFTSFQAEIVPQLWLLTKKVRSRIFQHLTIPGILQQLFAGLNVVYKLAEVYHPRDYCVQYRESDFAFASRLMEEEGIHYYFVHLEDAHRAVITDEAPNPPIPGQSSVIYEKVLGDDREDMRVTKWEKHQEIRAGSCTLWDHCFEIPNNQLEATEKTRESVKVGTTIHNLRVGGNAELEIYDYPGGYAQRFDGIEPHGLPRPQEIDNIFDDRTRTVRIRMEQEEAESLEIGGAGDCGNFTSGHKFQLERHIDGDGAYLLTSVEHEAKQSYDPAEEFGAFTYQNRFTCIPETLRFRPRRVTEKPVIGGVQTALVVGPFGEDIFVDKYGRVKVQFYWDREGKKNVNSSCWVRVSQVWAGKRWGAFFWPRIGNEVVVAFEEGDPDQPLIVGSVYNAENMPGFSLPANKELGGIKSASVRGSVNSEYNGIVFNDEKGREHLAIHSERNLSLNSEKDKMIHSGRHKGERVSVANVFTVGGFTPPGGGSGGGPGFNEGSPIPDPPPTGVLGMSAVVTFGDNMQAASPLNHQLAVGNNVQMCINPFGLAAGVPGGIVPEMLQTILGSGMGGSMQFTIGTSAQFTLGQTFEISIGPPKIEIHQSYDKHLPVAIICGILGAAAIAYMIVYGVSLPKQYTPPSGDTEPAADRASEQTGDKERADTTLVYQLLADVLLTTILAVECFIDHADWFGDDTLKGLFAVEAKTLGVWQGGSEPPADAAKPWWYQWGALSFGCADALAAIAAEILLTKDEGDSNSNKT